MRRIFKGAAAVVVVLTALLAGSRSARAAGGPTEIVTVPGPTANSDREAIAAALALLPKRPARIEIIDATRNEPAVRDYLLTLDAFITKGESVVYLVHQSQVLQGARVGSGLFRGMLASVIWHEMAHLEGSDERGARQAEEGIWMRFMRDGLADQITGLRYLDALRKRPDDQMMAMR